MSNGTVTFKEQHCLKLAKHFHVCTYSTPAERAGWCSKLLCVCQTDLDDNKVQKKSTLHLLRFWAGVHQNDGHLLLVLLQQQNARMLRLKKEVKTEEGSKKREEFYPQNCPTTE